MIAKLFAGILAFMERAWRKLVADRRRYAHGTGYRAAEYWRDRFERLGDSLAGPGHEGWSEERNKAAYEEARHILQRELDVVGGGRATDAVLEIGPGTGYWTEVCRERGIMKYVGVDITSARFSDLRTRFPAYQFVEADATEAVPPGPFDLVLLLDVIEHVVSVEGLAALFRNIEGAMSPGGLLAISFPPPGIGRRDLYYLRFWPVAQVLALLPTSSLLRQVDFRDGTLLLVRTPEIEA